MPIRIYTKYFTLSRFIFKSISESSKIFNEMPFINVSQNGKNNLFDNYEWLYDKIFGTQIVILQYLYTMKHYNIYFDNIIYKNTIQNDIVLQQIGWIKETGLVYQTGDEIKLTEKGLGFLSYLYYQYPFVYQDPLAYKNY